MNERTFVVKPTANNDLKAAIQRRLDSLTKPAGSLGRLEELAMRYCLCRGRADAAIERKMLYVFAADHGITDEGVAPYPKEVTVQMMRNMLDGGAAVSVMCRKAGVDYRIVDMGATKDVGDHPFLISRRIDRGTRSFLSGCAMEISQCRAAIDAGAGLAEETSCDIAAIGDMGIGNSSSASALYSLLMDKPAALTVGPGSGASGELLESKRRIIERAVCFHKTQWDGSAEDALRRAGGFEIAGMCGFILRCAQRRIPVVVDGFIATAAALCAMKMVSTVKEYLFFGHVSGEHFHRQALGLMGASPVLDLGMRLGEGTGAVLAVQIIEQALECYHRMATFTSAGVSGRAD